MDNFLGNNPKRLLSLEPLLRRQHILPSGADPRGCRCQILVLHHAKRSLTSIAGVLMIAARFDPARDEGSPG